MTQRVIVIQYADSLGEISTRHLMSYRFESGSFDPNADYLHATTASEEVKSYRVDRILSACYADTGESIAPWLIENPTGRQSAHSLVRPYVAAIKAMHSFVAATRGFRERERARFSEFVMELTSAPSSQTEEITAAAMRLGRADENTFVDPAHSAVCRRHALRIAAGSGRKPIEASWQTLIDQLFT